jgi:hypothetical protein
MHGPKNSILKRWHALTITPARARRIWRHPYWREQGGYRDINCAHCPRFEAGRVSCGIAFGTPLRKCAASAIEAHLNDCAGMQVLEIGFGRWMLPRNLVRRSGGSWTGIDPGQWGQIHGGRQPSEYADCMAEVRRVMKPDGRVYLDSPQHFHGHEMFIMGDVARIRAVFDNAGWQDIVVERWRREYAPLEKYPPSAKVQREWPTEISSYSDAEVEEVRDKASVWLLTISARNPR